MNKGIAHALRNWISLPFISKRAGLVQTQLKGQPVQLPEGGTRTTIKKFPVSCDVILADDTECDAGKLIDLIPNSKESGIMYFEDLGSQTTIMSDGTTSGTSKLRLVVWYDTRAVKPVDDDETISCWEYSTLVIQQILNIFSSKKYKHSGIYQKINVGVDRILPSDSSIFSKYSYDEEKLQYLMHPYDYFAMDLSVNFGISSKCTIEIKKGEVVC